MNVWQLCRLAGCAEPTSSGSRGADFLNQIAADTEDYLGQGDGPEYISDYAHEIADRCVPIYTLDIWETFVDLAAWSEDVAGELGMGDQSMEQQAQAALYLIGSRLAHELLEGSWGEDE